MLCSVCVVCCVCCVLCVDLSLWMSFPYIELYHTPMIIYFTSQSTNTSLFCWNWYNFNQQLYCILLPINLIHPSSKALPQPVLSNWQFSVGSMISFSSSYSFIDFILSEIHGVNTIILLHVLFAITSLLSLGFAINGINNVNTATYERRFLLSSAQAGLISSMFDIVAGITVSILLYIRLSLSS